MGYTSAYFFLFVAVTVFLYRVFPKNKRYLVLLCASIAFYYLYGIASLIAVTLTALTGFVFAIIIENFRPCESRHGHTGAERITLFIGLSSNILLLLIFRGDISSFGLLTFIGSSFFTLRNVSYMIDVYRKRISAERNPMKYLVFLSYFPLTLQGPLLRYGEIKDELFFGRKALPSEMLEGILRVLWGLFKKIVVADTLAAPIYRIINDTEVYSGIYVLILLVLYTARIYCDFSGGIDIALGTSKMLGIVLPENFKHPFSSLTVKEYWNRWHITLGQWFEDYVFYPLSLSRMMQKMSRWLRKKGMRAYLKKLPVYAATMVTWSLTGLWHGFAENYLVWGIVNGAMVLCGDEISSLQRSGKLFKIEIPLLSRARTFLLVGAVRLLDVYQNSRLTFKMLGSIFYDAESYGHFFAGGISSLGMSIPQGVLVICSVALITLVSNVERRIEKNDGRNRAYSGFGGKINGGVNSGYRLNRNTEIENKESGGLAARIARIPVAYCLCSLALALAVIVFGNYGIGFNNVDFIYSRF